MYVAVFCTETLCYVIKTILQLVTGNCIQLYNRLYGMSLLCIMEIPYTIYPANSKVPPFTIDPVCTVVLNNSVTIQGNFSKPNL